MNSGSLLLMKSKRALKNKKRLFKKKKIKSKILKISKMLLIVSVMYGILYFNFVILEMIRWIYHLLKMSCGAKIVKLNRIFFISILWNLFFLIY